MSAAFKELNRETWNHVRRQVRRFLSTADGHRGLRLLLLLTGMLVLINGLNVLSSYVGRDFISSIEHRDSAGFLHQAWLYIAVFAACAVAASVSRFMEERLGLLWRDWQTRQLLGRYLDDLVYYRIESGGTLRNPDQRIAEDVRTFTTTTLSFVLLLLNASITILSFSSVLWSISPRLFVVAVAYAITGSLMTVLVGRRLIGLNVQQLDYEADFRSELMHVRENADALALVRREEQQHRHLMSRLDRLVQNTRRIVTVNLDLNIFTNAYNYLIQIIPALLVAPLFIRGEAEFGVVTQSAMAFAFLSGAFSLVVTQFQSISSYTAVVARLGRLVEALDNARIGPRPPLELRLEGQRLAFEQLTLRRNDGRMLVQDLNLTLQRGAHVLVASASGHAKIALFRATAGLDCAASGRIIRPAAGDLLFLPERPYLLRGTLREQLARGGSHPPPGDAEATEVLRSLQLDEVLDEAGGLDVVHDWSSFVGISEQARLLFARALLARPYWVFADRLGAALSPQQAELVLGLLHQRGIGYIVLGKSGDAPQPFDAVLELAGDGGWAYRRFTRPALQRALVQGMEFIRGSPV